MLIQLPRQCSGQEVVEAFKLVSSIHVAANMRWEPKKFVEKFQYEPGSAKQTIRSMGVRTALAHFRKKWWLFGKRVWKLSFSPKFTLTPVVLSNLYNEVEVEVYYVYDTDPEGNFYVATNPHNPKFEDIRPQFETILANLFTHLQLHA